MARDPRVSPTSSTPVFFNLETFCKCDSYRCGVLPLAFRFRGGGGAGIERLYSELGKSGKLGRLWTGSQSASSSKAPFLPFRCLTMMNTSPKASKNPNTVPTAIPALDPFESPPL
ncbi:hypothetical protein OGAPHI_007292 [Ogataea philodendri]|uniref:Uncharacterized protein n=1 Tax=Ogataea philodendri TaxID=1378263 RepID=A0A9P8NVN4_9ASCO|nr:uncharacterized protein OGAPHI_007292 [Ogataea philodendri]KAH3660087.1 hypothetical protein OGAPHI_007292 [Ogataea philodendri]